MCSIGPGSLCIDSQRMPLPTILSVFRDAIISVDDLANAVLSGPIISYTAWREVSHCCMTVYIAVT
jgi:hypothetical protein